jgi:hypothetical protein
MVLDTARMIVETMVDRQVFRDGKRQGFPNSRIEATILTNHGSWLYRGYPISSKKCFQFRDLELQSDQKII